MFHFLFQQGVGVGKPMITGRLNLVDWDSDSHISSHFNIAMIELLKEAIRYFFHDKLWLFNQKIGTILTQAIIEICSNRIQW